MAEGGLSVGTGEHYTHDVSHPVNVGGLTLARSRSRLLLHARGQEDRFADFVTYRPVTLEALRVRPFFANSTT